MKDQDRKSQGLIPYQMGINWGASQTGATSFGCPRQAFTQFTDDKRPDLPEELARMPYVPFWSGAEDFQGQSGMNAPGGQSLSLFANTPRLRPRRRRQVHAKIVVKKRVHRGDSLTTTCPDYDSGLSNTTTTIRLLFNHPQFSTPYQPRSSHNGAF